MNRKSLYLNYGYCQTPFNENTFTDVTLAAWFNFQSLPASGNNATVFGYDGNYIDTALSVTWNNGSPVVFGQFVSAPKTYYPMVSPVSVKSGDWHHGVFRMKAYDYALFVDGVKVAANTTQGQRYMFANPFYFGLPAGISSPWPPVYMYIAEAAIWSRGLTDTECISTYHGAVKGTNGLEGYWPLNGDFLDYSGKGKNLGTASNASWVTAGPPDIDKYLLVDSNRIKTWTGVSLADVGSYPVDLTPELFSSQGFFPLSSVPQSAVNTLSSSSPNILCLADKYWTGPTATRTVAPPKTRIIKANDDIGLASIQCINSVALNSNATGSGLVRIVVSVDGGASWKA